MACVEEGWVGGLTLVGFAGPMARLVGSLDVRIGGAPLRRRPTRLRRGRQRGTAVAQCTKGHGVGVESCIPQRRFPGVATGPWCAGWGRGPEEYLVGWKGADTGAGSRADLSQRADGREQGDGQPAGR